MGNGNGTSDSEQIVYADAETLGLDRKRHSPFEVHLIKGDQELTLWLPVDLSKADPDALRINRFYERQKEGYEKFGVEGKEGAWKIAEYTSGCTVAGIVPSFDVGMVAAFMLRHGLKPAWNYWVRDVITFAAGAIGHRGKTSSKIVSELLGVPCPTAEEAHTAPGDARWAKRIDTKALELTSEEHRKRELETRIFSLLRDEGFDEPEETLQQTAARWASKLIPSVQKASA